MVVPVTECMQILIEDRVIFYLKNSGAPLILADGSNILSRDKPFVKEQEVKDSPNDALCLVVVGDEKQPPPEENPRTNSTWTFYYPVLIVVVTKDAIKKTKSSRERWLTRRGIRDVLYNHTLLGMEPNGVGLINRCVYNPSPEYNNVGFPEGYRLSFQLFIYRSEETRER